MLLDDLKFIHSIYPRNLDIGIFEGNMSKVEPNLENKNQIRDAILKGRRILQAIRYNKVNKHIIDGTHLWQALWEIHKDELETWKIPDYYLEEINIPINEELFWAGQFNYKHGLKITKREVWAVIASYMDKDGNIKYGLEKRFSEEYDIPYSTLREWIDMHIKPFIRGELTVLSTSAKNSVKDTKNDEFLDLRQELEQIRNELRTSQNAYAELKQKWDNRTTHVKCPKCKKEWDIY